MQVNWIKEPHVDHAKALADALRNTLTIIEELYSDSGGTDGLVTYERALEVLRRYDAHPAEAATRENVNLRQDLVQDSVNIYLTWKANEKSHGGNLHKLMRDVYDRISDALSAYQQQGAETKTASQKFADLWNDDCCEHPASTRADRIERMLMIALSRAPQPDTVTVPAHATAAWITAYDELYVRDTGRSPGGSILANDINRMIEAAALAARGKAE